MKKLVLITLVLISYFGFSQTFNSYYGSVVNNVSSDTLYHHLLSFQNFGVKKIPSTAINNAANWIIGKYQSFGYTDIKRDTFTYSGNELYNIVVTKTGTLFPDKYLIIDSHYDTYNSYTQHSPGANDNGSGVTAMLEIARLLSGISTEYSIKFLTFSGEELGMVGSQHYVGDEVNSTNMDILLVLNIDEVGGQNGVNNNTIKCESDQSSPTTNNLTSAKYTDTLSNITTQYSSLLTAITDAYGSDYMSFQSNNEIITGFYESPATSYYHKTTDIVANMNLPYFLQVTKASVAAALYFSKAYQVFTDMSTISNKNKINIYPNPVTDVLKINGLEGSDANIMVFDLQGKIVFSQNISGLNNEISVKDLYNGIYTYSIKTSDGILLKSGKLVKL